MEKSHTQHHVHVRHGAYLPHWTLDGAAYSVVFRLADSLPRAVVATRRRERDALHAKRTAPGAHLSAPDELHHERLSAAIERALDAGHGACWMKRPEIASLIADALCHFDGDRYQLAAWCVMPNHVHVVVRPLAPHSLDGIAQSWKGFTAWKANRLLARTGVFWQPEAYDHVIRDSAEFSHAVRYILENPIKAGLRDWPWVWANAAARRAAGLA